MDGLTQTIIMRHELDPDQEPFEGIERSGLTLPFRPTAVVITTVVYDDTIIRTVDVRGHELQSEEDVAAGLYVATPEDMRRRWTTHPATKSEQPLHQAPVWVRQLAGWDQK